MGYAIVVNYKGCSCICFMLGAFEGKLKELVPPPLPTL